MAKVSVLMSVYNGEPYLQESIESILNQTFKDFEFIIIDDCSNDNSAEIIAEYAKEDSRIITIKNQFNIGLTKSLNKGLKLAKGEYIARQDADDVSLPTRLEKEVVVLQNRSEIGLVSSNIEFIDSEGNYLGICQRDCEAYLANWYLLFYNRLAGHSQVMFRRQLATKLGGYDENRRYSQDYELWSRIVDISQIAIVPDILLKQRRHNQSISASKNSAQKEYSLSQSKQNIARLIGKQISLEQVENIRGFWLGHLYPERFPNVSSIRALNLTLSDLTLAFVEHKNRQFDLSPTEIKNIYLLVGRQFAHWLQSPLTRQQGMKAKIIVSYYVFIWHPGSIPISWLKLFYKTLIVILRKINNINMLKHNKTVTVRSK